MNPQDLIEYDGPDRIVHFTEYLKIKEKENFNLGNFKSGFSKFDEKLNGLCTSEVTVISGKTGEGKTTFAESWINGILKHNPDVKACLFSFEVPARSLLAKYKDSPQLKFYLPLQLETSNISWLEERIWESAVKENCRLFMLDHLHFLIDMAERQNMSLNIGKLMRDLKRIAMKLNISIILIAHQAKGATAQGRKQEDPSLENIRDSTFIAQEADNVILIWRRVNFTEKELKEIDNPIARKNIQARKMNVLAPIDDKYSDQFCVVQIGKARRNGAFRWKKLFQKVGNFLEEV